MSAFFNYFWVLGVLFIPPKICPGLTIFNNMDLNIRIVVTLTYRLKL